MTFIGMGQNKERTQVYFKFNDYTLDKTTKNRIDSFLRNKTVQWISLQGHCDSLGTHDYNDILSSKRGQEVKKYLVSAGIPENVIKIKGLGKRIPLTKNQSEHERSLNRRVDIELVLKHEPKTADTSRTKRYSKNFIQENTEEVLINGIILNEQNQPIMAEISLNDTHGNEIQSTKSDKNGNYTLKTTLNKREDYSLIYYHDSSFVSSRKINLSNPRLSYKNLKTVLHQLKEGNKYTLQNFHFVGDTSQLVASSLPSLEALYKLMRKNKSLVIRIEGHVNYPNYWGNPKKNAPHSDKYVPPGMDYEEFNQWLSDERAKMIYNYLVDKGIDPERISTVGHGARKMLFPDAVSESEQAQNRRVEINVVSFR